MECLETCPGHLLDKLTMKNLFVSAHVIVCNERIRDAGEEAGIYDTTGQTLASQCSRETSHLANYRI